MIALLMGLTFVILAHVIFCAVSELDGQRVHPAMAATADARPHGVQGADRAESTLGCPVDDVGHGVAGCCGHTSCAYAVPSRSGPATSMIGTIDLAALGLVRAYAAQVHPAAAMLSYALPPPLTGTAVLRMACISRT